MSIVKVATKEPCSVPGFLAARIVDSPTTTFFMRPWECSAEVRAAPLGTLLELTYESCGWRADVRRLV